MAGSEVPTAEQQRSPGLLEAVAQAAERLRVAAAERRPCQPVRDLIGATRIDLAYAVQRRLTEQRIASGATIVGRKIGLTAPAVQQQFGVNQPDFGVLLDDMIAAEDAPVDIGRLLQPRVEAEIAFVLCDDIVDAAATARSVRSAVAEAVAAIEIIDSRIAGWDITITDTIADNASSGMFVIGAEPRTLDELEPADVVMTMTIDGVVRSTGNGTACLGDPLNALAWLARTAIAMGSPLQTGDIVLSGALGPVVPVAHGATVIAEISGLGSVSAFFANGSTT
jgi:2-keto-4-pentenoate hydratase